MASASAVAVGDLWQVVSCLSSSDGAGSGSDTILENAELAVASSYGWRRFCCGSIGACALHGPEEVVVKLSSVVSVDVAGEVPQELVVEAE